MVSFSETFWNILFCRYRRKTIDVETENFEEETFLLEDDAECEVLSDQKIISQIMAAQQHTEP